MSEMERKEYQTRVAELEKALRLAVERNQGLREANVYLTRELCRMNQDREYVSPWESLSPPDWQFASH